MKAFGSKSLKRDGKVWVLVGYSFKRFGFGIEISKYSINIDLAFFWIGIEF